MGVSAARGVSAAWGVSTSIVSSSRAGVDNDFGVDTSAKVLALDFLFGGILILYKGNYMMGIVMMYSYPSYPNILANNWYLRVW